MIDSLAAGQQGDSMDYIPGHPDTAEGFERAPWRIHINDPNELEGKRVLAANVGDIVRLEVVAGECGSAGVWAGRVVEQDIMPRLVQIEAPCVEGLAEWVSVPALRSVAPHIASATQAAALDAMGLTPGIPERAVESWHPPEGMTPGDMAASFEVLTVDDLRGLPVGSVFVDLSRDAVGRPIGHSAYRVVSAGMVEACDGRKYDWRGSVGVFEEIDMGNAMRLVYRGADAPSEAPEPIPAPVCFVEPGDVTASKTEAIATPAQSGWSMYED